MHDLPRAAIPELDRLVLAARGQPLSVGAEGQRGDRPGGCPPGVFADAQHCIPQSAVHIPDGNRAVATSGGHQRFARRKGQGEHGVSMPLERGDRFGQSDIPQRDAADLAFGDGGRVSAIRRGEQTTVWREGDGTDRVAMSAQRCLENGPPFRCSEPQTVAAVRADGRLRRRAPSALPRSYRTGNVFASHWTSVVSSLSSRLHIPRPRRRLAAGAARWWSCLFRGPTLMIRLSLPGQRAKGRVGSTPSPPQNPIQNSQIGDESVVTWAAASRKNEAKGVTARGVLRLVMGSSVTEGKQGAMP